jgi:molybdopterin converting factor small subunit
MSNRQKPITVLYFASASTATGRTSEEIILPDGGIKLSELSALLTLRYPGTHLDAILSTSQWSVDLEMVDDPAMVVLKGGEEIGVICPVSGG